MTERPSKSPPLASGEQQHANPAQFNGQHGNVIPYPSAGGYPPFYTYPPPPTDANGQSADAGASNGAPSGTYLMAFPPPPGVIYAYPPAQGFPFAPGVSVPSALSRPKRKQVKMACTNCAAACKRCDEGRPCKRCLKYGIADSCRDGIRKERKKGTKRGPYKRKGKYPEGASFEGDEEYPPEAGPPEEWPPQNPATAGYYPYFYPAPGFVPIGPDGQPLQPDAANGVNGGHSQYFPLHPAYPPYAPFHPNGAFPQGVAPSQMQLHPPASLTKPAGTMDPTKSTINRADEEQAESSGKGKKRARSTKEDEELSSPKLKRARTTKSATAPANGTSKKAGRKSTTVNEAEEHPIVEKSEVQPQENEVVLTANPQELSV